MIAQNERTRILKANEVILFGAHAVAYEIYHGLAAVYGIVPKCFLVTRREENPAGIDGIPVIPLSQYAPAPGQLILIATPEPYHGQIIESLRELGDVDYLCVDSRLEYGIMSEYFRKKTAFRLLGDCPEPEGGRSSMPDIQILVAKSHVDRPLQNAPRAGRWTRPIQAGAALTDAQITDLKDNEGSHISQKNGNYSELTATYWAWQNLRCDYKGLFHYRRALRFDEAAARKMMGNDIDVVLPLPFVCTPDTSGQYGRYISEEDIRVTLQMLRRLHPDDYDATQTVLADRYLYNYNMLIAKAEVFDRYCGWMFPVLQAIEEHYEALGIYRRDRYLGYIGELLTALYFLSRRNDLKVAHGEKVWFV